MPSYLHARLAGSKEAKEKLRAMRPAFVELFRQIAIVGRETATQGAPGHFASTIQSEARDLMAQVSSTDPAALPVETGRKPGGRMPPPDALAGWAARRGFVGSTFVLARQIALRGVRGRFFMRAARRKIVRDFNKLVKAMEWP